MAEKRTLTVVKLLTHTKGKATKNGPVDYYLYKVKTENGLHETAQSWGRELKIGVMANYIVRPGKGAYPMSIVPVYDSKIVVKENEHILMQIAQDLARISTTLKHLVNDSQQ